MNLLLRACLGFFLRENQCFMNLTASQRGRLPRQSPLLRYCRNHKALIFSSKKSRHALIKIITCSALILFIFNGLTAQQTKIQIQVPDISNTIFSSDHGLWLTIATGNRVGWQNKFVKFAPDLSKTAWEAELPKGVINSNWAFDPGSPKYFYLFNVETRPNVTSFAKKTLIQVGPDGKLEEKIYPKKRELDIIAYRFADADFYYEIWADEKFEELMLIKYEHKSMNITKIKLNLAEITKGFGGWIFGGQSSGKVLFYRCGEKKNKGQYDLRLVSLVNGKVENQFTCTPDLGEKVIAPCASNRLGLGEDMGHNIDVSKFNFNPIGYNTHGNFRLSPDANSIYFDALISFSGNKRMGLGDTKPEGYLIQKMNLTGKSDWQIEEKVGKEDVGVMFSLSARDNIFMELQDLHNDGNMGYSIIFMTSVIVVGNAKRDYKTFGISFDPQGKILDACEKGVTFKPAGFKSSKTTVKGFDSLIPCFPNGSANSFYEYLKKAPKGIYSAQMGKNSQILMSQKSEKSETWNLMFFKD